MIAKKRHSLVPGKGYNLTSTPKVGVISQLYIYPLFILEPFRGNQGAFHNSALSKSK
jgi:hypothetical protein